MKFKNTNSLSEFEKVLALTIAVFILMQSFALWVWVGKTMGVLQAICFGIPTCLAALFFMFREKQNEK
jgi:hypothetical protein